MTSSLFPYDCVADRIRQARQVMHRPVLVVEGRDDERFVRRIGALSSSDVFIAYTRDRVLDAAADLRQLSVERVACIVDRDFDDKVGDAERDGLAIAAYDNADLEAMLWMSVSLDELLAEVGSEDKLAAYGGVSALRNKVVEVLTPVTRLRRASAMEGWGLDFDSVNLASKVDLRTLAIKVQSLCDSLWDEDIGIEKRVLYDAAAHYPLPHCPYTSVDLVRGKDALVVTGVALRKLVGSWTHQQAAYEQLESVLRLTAPEASAASGTWLARAVALLT